MRHLAARAARRARNRSHNDRSRLASRVSRKLARAGAPPASRLRRVLARLVQRRPRAAGRGGGSHPRAAGNPLHRRRCTGARTSRGRRGADRSLGLYVRRPQMAVRSDGHRWPMGQRAIFARQHSRLDRAGRYHSQGRRRTRKRYAQLRGLRRDDRGAAHLRRGILRARRNPNPPARENRRAARSALRKYRLEVGRAARSRHPRIRAAAVGAIRGVGRRGTGSLRRRGQTAASAV